MADIRLLRDFPDYSAILAYWAYLEWYRDRDIDFDTVFRAYKVRSDDSALPFSMVALEQGIPAGMVSLKENDLWSRRDLNPWLSSLYVTPEFRKRGTGTKLVEALLERAVCSGYNEIYLFTSGKNMKKLANFYKKRGWIYISSTKGNYGGEARVFVKSMIK